MATKPALMMTAGPMDNFRSISLYVQLQYLTKKIGIITLAKM